MDVDARRIVVTIDPWLLAIIMAVWLLATATYLSLRMRATYQASAEAAEAMQTVNEQAKDFAAFRDQIQVEMNSLKATMYGPQSPTRRRSAVELWQKERDKAIQDRLRALEQWRYRTERE